MIRIPRIPLVLVLSSLVACSDADDSGGDDDGVASSPGDDDGNNGNDDNDGNDSNAADDGNAGADGNAPTDNVSACNDLKSSLQCGGVDYGAQIDCDAYKDIACDLSPYLECLDDNFTCESDAFDPSKWTACASLASC